jgi:hypothetical protein
VFQLQSNIPLPRTIRPKAKGRRRKYPFESMQVGSFFFVPGIVREQIYGHVYHTGKQIGFKFAVRACYMRHVSDEWQICEANDKGATLGVGVWRTE